MKRLSFWAKQHYWTARVLIVLIKFTLIGCAIFIGQTIKSSGVILSPLIFYVTAVLLLIVTFYYPQKQQKKWLGKNAFYVRQKLFDMAAITTSFVLIMFIAGNYKDKNFNNELNASFIGKKVKQKPSAEEILASLKYRDKSSLTHTEKRVLKKEFRSQLGVYIKSKITGNKKEGDKAALIILTIIGAIGLAVLLAALVCNISCSGNDGLAAIVALVGLAGIIWLTIVIIRQINKKKNKSNSGGA